MSKPIDADAPNLKPRTPGIRDHKPRDIGSTIDPRNFGARDHKPKPDSAIDPRDAGQINKISTPKFLNTLDFRIVYPVLKTKPKHDPDRRKPPYFNPADPSFNSPGW